MKSVGGKSSVIKTFPFLLGGVLLVLLHSPATIAHESACHVCRNDVDTNSTSTVCENLTTAANLLTNGTDELCHAIQYRGVTAGCCEEPDDFCNLCETGDRLPDPEMRVSGVTCAQIGGVASFAPTGPCKAFQATYGVYCGCDNTIASVDACRICGDNVAVSNRNLVLAPEFQTNEGAPARRFCGALEFFSQFMINATDPLPSCSAYQTKFSDVCCDGDTTGGPVTSDTDSPAGANDDTSSAPVAAPLTSNTTRAPVGSSANMTYTAPATNRTTTPPVQAPVKFNVTTPTRAPVTAAPAVAPAVSPVKTATTPSAATGGRGWPTVAVWTTMSLVAATMLLN